MYSYKGVLGTVYHVTHMILLGPLSLLLPHYCLVTHAQQFPIL